MKYITTFRKDWIQETLPWNRLVESPDEIDWKLQIFRGEVSDWVFEILMRGTIEAHDEQSKKLIAKGEV